MVGPGLQIPLGVTEFLSKAGGAPTSHGLGKQSVLRVFLWNISR